MNYHSVENPLRDHRLAEATTFEELAAIALGEIALLKPPVGIVCGPLTTGKRGTFEQNVVDFKRWIGIFQNAGISMFDQMPYEDSMQRIKLTPYYKGGNHLLETYYGLIFPKLNIWFFRFGSETSFGAEWERNLVTEIKGKIVDLPDLPIDYDPKRLIIKPDFSVLYSPPLHP